MGKGEKRARERDQKKGTEIGHRECYVTLMCFKYWKQSYFWMQLFGVELDRSFLLTVELFYSQLCLGASLLTARAFFTYNWSLSTYN